MFMESRGLLIVISGPSGVGKGSICKALLARDKNIIYSVSVTTRAPRKGEIEGKSYFFISKDEFIRRRDKGEFLEWAKVFDNYYATPAAEVEKLLKAGKNVVLEIDTQGAMQIKSACPKGVFIFILPPSYSELEKRIIKRGSETKDTLKRRLASAKEEIESANNYDFQVINDDIEKSADTILKIITKIKTDRQNQM
jgi:guanylate kinase